MLALHYDNILARHLADLELTLNPHLGCYNIVTLRDKGSENFITRKKNSIFAM